MNFKNKLKAKLKDVLNEEELKLLPRGFQTLGNVIILKLNPKLYDKKDIISKFYLELLPKDEVITILKKYGLTDKESKKLLK